MSTFNLPSPNASCLVHLPSDGSITQDQLLAFPGFKTWLSTITHSLSIQTKSRAHAFNENPYSLKTVQIHNVHKFGGGRIGFLNLSAEVSNGHGEKLPGIAFLRGGSVAMMILLQPNDSSSEDDTHVLLTVQPRIAAGSLTFVELPAGMIDDAGTFSGAAAEEIEEETGLSVPQDQLLDMTSLALLSGSSSTGAEEKLQKAVYPSPGGCDEFVSIFLHRREVEREQLKEWTGKLTGLRDEGEKITLKCVPLRDLWKEAGRDAKALSALALYQGLKREGRL